MKTEHKQLLGFLGRCAVLIAFASLYAIAGSGDFWGGQLWIRRWLAPGLLCLWGVVISRDWRPLVCFPIMGASLTLPYGADVLWQKILFRGLFGAAAGLAFNGINLWCQRWLLGIFGISLAITGSIILGAWNPLTDPMQEQGLIAVLIAAGFVFGVRRKLI